MDKHRSLSLLNSPIWGAVQIAGLYLLIGGLWILFSDRVAARIASNEQMLTTISVYKGWGYVLITALLLYLLIRRHTAALRASEVKLHRVLDAMPAFISYVDTDRRYQFTNKTYKEWYDEKPEGKYVEEVIGKTAYRTVSKYIDKVLTGETVDYEAMIPYQDTEIFMSVKYIPDIATDGQVQGFFVMAQDRTAQRQAEEELRLWADAFEGCYHGIAIADPHTNRIVVCNPAFAGMLKHSVEDVIGSAILSLYAPSDHEHVRRQIEKADQIGYVRYEAQMIRKDGSIFPVQIDVVSVLADDGELLHRVVTAQDISERNSIDEKLKESETKYRTLVEHLPAITYISEPDAYIGVTYVSPQIESLGFDRDAWLADPELWFRQIHPDDQERVTSELQEFEAGAESFKSEYRLMLPNGEARWFHDESIRVKDQSGKTILKQGFMLDITDSKQAEEQSKSLARFPDENPNPVLRATHEGKIIYANTASQPLLKDWKSNVGDDLPADWKKLINELFNTGTRKTIDVQCGKTTYSIMIAPVPGASYVNLYGRDVTERKQAEERFASAFHSSPTPIALTRLADGKIMDVNEAFCQLFGYSHEEIVGRTSLEVGIADPESRQKAVKELEDKGVIRNLEQKAKDRRGRQLHILNSVERINVNGEPYALTTLIDNTKRKQAEEVLHNQQAQITGILNSAMDAIISTDTDQRILIFNPAAEAMFLCSQVEAIGQPLERFIPERFREAHQRYVHNFGQTGVTNRGMKGSAVVYGRRSNGDEFPSEASISQADIDGKKIYTVILRDITERQQAEEYLRRFELLSEHSRDIILFMDRENGRILEANAAALQAYGYSRDELLSLNIRELRAGNTQALTANQMAQADAGGILFETFHQRKDGTTFPVEVSSQGATIGGVRTLISIIRDITGRKQAEDALRQSEQRLNRAQEIAHLGSWELDLVNNRLTWSDEVYRIFGLQPQEFGATYEAFLKAVHPEDRAMVDDAYSSSIREDRDSYELEHRVVKRSSGEVRIVHEKCEHFRSQNGQIIRSVGMVHDITQRKRAEEALQASQEQLLSLIKQAPISIAMFDREMRYIVTSQRWVAEYGRGYSDLVGRSHYEIHPDLPERWKESHRRGIAGEALRNDNDLWTQADGTRHWLRWAIVPWHNAEGEIGGIIISAEDITASKLAEEALRLKDDLLRLTSEMAKVGGWEFDAQTGRGTWTDEVAKIHDLDPAQQTNVEIGLSFYASESREKVEQAIKEAIELSKPYDLELEMMTAKGNRKWVRTIGLPVVQDGKVVKVKGIFQDITERKQIEKALKAAHDELELKVQERTAALSEANALLQALMDHMPDQIYFKDTQGRFIRNSRSQANLLGLSDPVQAIGKTDFDFFPHAAKAFAEEQDVMRSGTPLVDLEEWVIWPDGREMWVSTTKVPLQNAEGETIGIFGISHDITERKRTEQAIRQLNVDLEKQAEQLKAANKELEAFSYSVSHDLRAPLRAIDGYTRILVEDYEAILDEEGKRVCGIIGREARRMGQLIDDLLAFSRLGRKQMYSSKIDMRTLAVSVLNDLLKEEERQRIDFRIGKLPSISGDSSLIRQVWVNLLSNAIKFTSKSEQAVIEVGSKTNKEEIVYYVRDTGAGFDMEYANKLFGVFQRLHSESEFDGTGVGLAIVQRIIHRHEGRVWAEGEVGKGATFYFALPRKEHNHE